MGAMEPLILADVFSDSRRADLLAVCDATWASGNCVSNDGFGRVTSNDGPFYQFLTELTPLARRTFGEPDLLPSYACWARYFKPSSNLSRHKDDNACTFTLDYCVRQIQPWDIYVEGQPYTLQENEVLAFMGEDQEHWRETFAPGNVVEMIFFHFVRPDHWYFNPDAPRPPRFADFVSLERPDV